MARFVFFILFVMLAVTTFVNCSTASKERVREAQLLKELKVQSEDVGNGLTGRLARGYPGPAIPSRRIPPVHAHVGGHHKPCHQGEAC